MIKELILRPSVLVAAELIAVAVILFGCATPNKTWLAQAFGDYIRSIEGQANIEKIPGLIIAGRDKWLPPGPEWDAFAAGVIREYIKANPQNDAELNKVLESLAMQLNTKR